MVRPNGSSRKDLVAAEGRGFDRRTLGVLTGLVIAGCLALAASNAFVVDDAFISFRYARNLVETGELTWNPGESVPVEGYTNFLWTLLLAAVFAVGLEPVLASQALGLIAFLGSLLMIYRLGLEVLGSPGRATVAVGLLGTNYTFSCFATGGLETQLQAFLITAGCWAAKRIADTDTKVGGLALLSTLAGFATLTRLDSLLPFGLLFAWAWIPWLRTRPSPKALIMATLASAGPALLLLGPWLLWKLAYYGDVFPNTYYAKVLPVSLAMFGQGLGYVFNFIYSYQLLPFVVLALAKAKTLLRQDLLACSLVILAWFAYVARVGGGFMEFRMLVPVLPLVFLVITFLTFQLPVRPRNLLIAFVVFGSAFHAVNFKVSAEVETMASLRSHLEPGGEAWPQIGKVLGQHFGGAEKPVTLAIGAAGAIPYYSRLPTVDTLGLNDLWLARQKPMKGIRPGHGIRAGFAYLVQRDVQLVFGHPIPGPLVTPTKPTQPLSIQQLAYYARVDLPALPKGARLLQIPIDAERGIKVVYLVPHPRVEEVIARHSWVTWPIKNDG